MNKTLKTIKYIGEDENCIIAFQEAVELVGASIVAQELDHQTGRLIPVDDDYYVKFVWC